MKKLALVLALFVFAVISYGQDITVKGLKNTFDYQLSFEKPVLYYVIYGDEVADTIAASETWSKDFIVMDFDQNIKSQCRFALDSISGSPNVTVTLEGKYSYNDSYTTIATATWAGTSPDTTIILQGTTAVPYRFLNAKAVSSATAQKVQIERLELGISK